MAAPCGLAGSVQLLPGGVLRLDGCTFIEGFPTSGVGRIADDLFELDVRVPGGQLHYLHPLHGTSTVTGVVDGTVIDISR